MQEDTYNLQDLSGLIRRRWRLIAIVFLSLVLTSIVVAYSLDNLYRSAGRIVIVQPEVMRSGPAPGGDREQRIARINDVIMTRSNLTSVVEKHGLYPEERGDRGPESVVGLLRANTNIELILEGEDDPRVKNLGDALGVEVAFYYGDPVASRDVARDIMDLFLEEDQQRRQKAYDEAVAVLARESGTLRGQVSEVERQLAEFKRRNPGALPEDRKYNIQIMERKARDLDGLDREIRSLQERKTLLQTQLAQTSLWVGTVTADGQALPATSDRLQALQAQYLQMLGNYSADHPDVQRLQREIRALTGGSANPAFRQVLEVELAAKRAELSDARTQYSPDHPDVRNLERAVATLEDQIADMPTDPQSSPPPNNPIYLNLQVQIQGVNNELAALRSNRARLRQEIGEFDSKVLIAPEVEREYLELTRDLGMARDQYQSTTERLMGLERDRVRWEEELFERYEVQYYPTVSYKPAFPNRMLFFVVGGFLGLTFGIAAGIVAETVDGTVRSTRDIRSILEMPPIAAIPVVKTLDDMRQDRLRRIFSVVGVVLVLSMVAAYVHLQRAGIA